MRHFYLDASALAKRYTPEAGTAGVDHLFANVPADRLLVFNVGIAEVVSVLVRKRNAGSLSDPVLQQALLDLGAEIVTEGLVWIVDPLDGTTNFLHRYPSCSVSIAAAVDGRLEAGVVLRLEPDWCFAAARGQGAWHGTTRLEVSTVSEPAHALIGTGFPFKQPEDLPRYQRQFAKVMSATSGIRRAGSAALDLADVAAGKFDGFWELTLAPWDVAAGMLLVREAGGVVTNLDGSERTIDHGPLVAGNPAIHQWLLRNLAS